MSASNNRNKEYETFHHLTSRIAHQVFFLKSDERNDFIRRMQRVAEFCGIRLVGWCVLDNHFHIFAYLPKPEELSEDEVVRRVGVLKGKSEAAELRQTLDFLHKLPDDGASVSAELTRWTRRMYSIGEFMKILKQWTTMDYNSRYGHRGTLWEATYKDRSVGSGMSDLSRVLAYIHLNPIRAAACAVYDEYPWSSFRDFMRGESTAIAGMRMVYGDEDSIEEIGARHIALMDELLEEEKLKRAEEIARKRAAGYELPPDPLTDEAMIAQAAAHLEEVQKASMELATKDELKSSKNARRQEALERSIVDALNANPNIGVVALAEALGRSQSSVYSAIRKLKKQGVLTQKQRGSAWCVNYKNGVNEV